MPMTTKDPRGLRHLAPSRYDDRGVCSVPPGCVEYGGVHGQLVTGMGRGQSGSLLQTTRGCNLHYALYEIGPWQGSRQWWCAKKTLRTGVHIAWPGRGTTLVCFEQKKWVCNLAPSWPCVSCLDFRLLPHRGLTRSLARTTLPNAAGGRAAIHGPRLLANPTPARPVCSHFPAVFPPAASPQGGGACWRA
jgi:hypothetical protein